MEIAIFVVIFVLAGAISTYYGIRHMRANDEARGWSGRSESSFETHWEAARDAKAMDRMAGGR